MREFESDGIVFLPHACEAFNHIEGIVDLLVASYRSVCTELFCGPCASQNQKLLIKCWSRELMIYKSYSLSVNYGKAIALTMDMYCEEAITEYCCTTHKEAAKANVCIEIATVMLFEGCRWAGSHMFLCRILESPALRDRTHPLW
jgi:hypothetical protein